MSECGFLAHDPARGRSLAARLAEWRAAAPMLTSTQDALFGVGDETLQRIERGEVEPEPELAERIQSVLDHYQSIPVRFSSGGASAPFASASLPGEANGGGAAAHPAKARNPGAPSRGAPLHFPDAPVSPQAHPGRPSFTLETPDEGGAHVNMHLGGRVFPLPLPVAQSIAADLFLLLSLAAEPNLFRTAERVSR
ncbi:MAG TPA: helix-turn-helix transcriptional regulator [Allosphingosinicella sp.]|jgi:DNA-binding XRE family transcriptional regulator